MSLSRDLRPKVKSISVASGEIYDSYLRGLGLRVSEGRIEVDLESTIVVPVGVTPESEQRKYNIYLSDVNALVERFAHYYTLDSNALKGDAQSIGRPITSIEPPFPPIASSEHIHRASEHWLHNANNAVDKDHWTGQAARSFRNNFLTPFRDTAAVQMACSFVLATVAESCYRGTAEVEKALLEIADQTLQRLTGTGPKVEVGAFKLLSIIASVAGVFLSGGLGVAISIGGFAADIASNFEKVNSPNPSHWEVTGGNGPQIIQSALSQITKLETLIHEMDDDMSRALKGDRADLFQSASVAHKRPAIADDADAFGTAVGTTPGILVKELARLYRLGYQGLPAAAREYGMARAKVSEATDPPEALFPRTRAQYNGAKVELHNTLLGTQKALRDSGATLVTVAKSYELTDEQNADLVNRIGKIESETGLKRRVEAARTPFALLARLMSPPPATPPR